MAIAYPQMRLDVDALDHNIDVMARWCADRDVLLAPHVKTTMSPQIVERQCAAGAWAVTVATVDQVRTVLDWGHTSVLLANEVVDRQALEAIAAWLEHDSRSTVRCLVDSPAGVHAAAAVFAGRGRPLDVLIEVGTPGGRAGVRTASAARELATLVHETSHLRLVGVAGYEGVVPNSRDDDTLADVDAHCRRVCDVYLDVAEFFDTDQPVFSMGGSAFPDRVIAVLPTDDDVPGTRRVLRSGCYVTHDHGTYQRVSPIPELTAAVSIRAVVLSVPEAGTAVVGAGKRDLPYDTDLPTVLAVRDANGAMRTGSTGTVHKLYDHHAVLTGVRGVDVGDLVDFGISHPCSAFDRWSEFVVVDAEGAVVDLWPTDFRRRSLCARTAD